ncbi:putative secretion ATPase, PEP-CTERM locus family protein [delta proteobacterium NaphS2]|nr:putative secretion ATPase, PEP-CTERM locus family protein [delta proteobacterium NaphS2]
MYTSFYGLKEKPFDLHPDPGFLYMSRGHENAYTHLDYAVRENKGFVIVTGEIGSGKTTLINFLLTKIRQNVEVGLISNTSLTPEQFIMMICEEFEVSLDSSDVTDKARMLARFHAFLLEQFGRKKRVILIVDEAQNLTPDALEEIRMLSNLESEKHHLIQIILVGQPELKYKLQMKELEQFTQRITVHCHLEGLGPEEVDHYIRYRMQVAGATRGDIFLPDAIAAVHRYSEGIPRLINIICDTALVFGFADSLTVIDGEVIEAVVKARKAGGLFDPDEKEETEQIQPSETPKNLPAGRETLEIVRSLEARIQSLETVIAGHQKQMELLQNTKEKRDEIVIALFKMLKESLESRMKMAEPYAQLSKLNDSADPSDSEPEVPVHGLRKETVSGLRSKWVLWIIIAFVAIGAVVFIFLGDNSFISPK